MRGRLVPNPAVLVVSLAVGVGMLVAGLASGAPAMWILIVLASLAFGTYSLVTRSMPLAPSVELDEVADGGSWRPPLPASPTVGQRLEELEALRRKGAITREEHDRERRRILSEA